MSNRFVYLESSNNKSKRSKHGAKSGRSRESIPTRTFFTFLADLMRLRIFHDNQGRHHDEFSYN